MAAGQNVPIDHVRRMPIARGANLLPFGSIVNAVPVNWRIGQNYAEPPPWRAPLVHGTHSGEQPLVHWRIPNKNIDGIPPDADQLLRRNGFTRGVSVHRTLVPRIAELDDDVAAAWQKARVSEQGDNEVVDLLIPVPFADCDQPIDVERVDDCRDGRLGAGVSQCDSVWASQTEVRGCQDRGECDRGSGRHRNPSNA